MAFPSDIASFKLIGDLLPKYDGNPKRLNFYIREIENILNLLEESARVHPAVICLIKSRLSGTATDAIVYENTLTSWNEIKAALIQRLSDPRNETQITQELFRVRRNKNEDAGSLGKRIREILDTLLSIGEHTNKCHYENMAIEQYTNNLEFHISIGVRIAKPHTLESAIVIARQEEARLAYNKSNYINYNTPSTSAQAKFKEPFRSLSQPRNLTQNSSSNKTPERHWSKPIVPWKNRPPSGTWRPPSGNFGQNIPQQQVSSPQKLSDVTMRSITKPQKPQFAAEQLFYTGSPGQHDQPYDDNEVHYNQQGEYQHCDEHHQDFYEGQEPHDET